MLRLIPVYGYDQRMEIFGEKGMIQVENKLNSTVVVANDKGFNEENTQPGREYVVTKFMFLGLTRYAQAYANEINHYINVLRGKEAKKVSHQDSRLNARIADTAVLAFKTGKAQKLIA